ncbi:Ltp family lipoprotein [Brachybacterium kimchii]|uniref:Ltp family lipoprotein n=1 Tax=Brachybacterium kimchii TaxID=2942909 RepID=A0ABY4N2X1_9MICO|nr:Ltp family lipoprotein [Brachybacterium kimchii]UQN28902.1 Ltp family lipoprotein [Brachybacterium kimchii]
MTSSTPSPENNGSANSGFPDAGSANGAYGSAGDTYGSASGPYGAADGASGSAAPAPQYGDSSQAPQFSASPQTPGQGQEPPKKSKTLWWVLGGCGCLALLAIAAVIIVIVVLVNSADTDDEPAPTTVSASSSDDDASDEPSDSATPSDHTVDATPDDESSADADDSGDSAADGTDVDPDDKDGALADAKIQSDMLFSSKKGIHDTLVFEGYSEETATYAVDHVDADWNKNALEKAKSYSADGMSDDEIRDQITSEYGEQFTKEQADYAIKHLHD